MKIFITLVIFYSLTFLGLNIKAQITSLTDYSFVASGYGYLTDPSVPAPGNQSPYIPDLTTLNTLSVVYVSNNGNGNGASESTPTTIQNALSGGAQNKVIIAADGVYTLNNVPLNNISNVHLIAKNKGGATINSGSSNNFGLANSNVSVHDFSIIGFKAIGNNNYFIFGPGNGLNYNVFNIYLSNMEWSGYSCVVYSGLHSHDWTIDKSLFYNSTHEYIWYMMGWHHTIMNTVLYNDAYMGIAIRGSYPPNEEYFYNQQGQPQIINRTNHFLASNDWSHMIINNTFGSNHLSIPNHTRDVHMSMWFDTPSDEIGMTEDCYFPPKNIVIANNAFIDLGTTNKMGILFAASRGVNDPDPTNIASVNGTQILNNFTDNNTLVDPYGTTDISTIDLSSNTVSFSNFGFDDPNRDYTIPNTSGLVDQGSVTTYIPNVDNAGSIRSSIPDVGAFEANFSVSPAIQTNFSSEINPCNFNVNFTDYSSNSPNSWQWDFGDGNSSTTQNPSHTYATSGVYNVSLTANNANGSDDTTITINLLPSILAPVTTDNDRCGNGIVSLNATASDDIHWFSSSSSSTIINTGSSFTTPSLNTSTTYYVENEKQTSTSFFGAKANKGSVGNYYEWDDNDASWGLKFDVTAGFVLKSVKVYNGMSTNGSYNGSRTITVLDNLGSVVATKVVNVVAGEQRLILDFPIPAGTGYSLISDRHLGFWKDNQDTHFPYTVNNNITILSGVRYDGVAPSNPLTYYFFYDWEIKGMDVTCVSPRVPIVATINPISVANFTSNTTGQNVVFTNTSLNYTSQYWDFGDGSNSSLANPNHQYSGSGNFNVTLTTSNSCGDSTIIKTIEILSNLVSEKGRKTFKIYPNPVKDKLFIENSLLENYDLQIFNSNMQIVIDIKKQSSKLDNLNLTNLAQGTYLIKIMTNRYVQYEKIQIIK